MNICTDANNQPEAGTLGRVLLRDSAAKHMQSMVEESCECDSRHL